MPIGFTDQLMRARKRAQLSGRPLTKQETSGIAEGYAGQASEKAFKMKGLDQQYKMHQETLAQRRREENAKMEAAKSQQKAQAASGAVLGAYVGGTAAAGSAAMGATFGAAAGPIGAVVGLGVGYAASGGCIIISACTDPDSYEVNLSREYRDQMLGPVTLEGYYILASFIVPLIKRSKVFKFLTKKVLVDRLVDYGEYILGYKFHMKHRTSTFITKKFLGLCRFLGYLKIEMEEAKNA